MVWEAGAGFCTTGTGFWGFCWFWRWDMVAIGEGGGAGEVTGDGDTDGLGTNKGADWDRGGADECTASGKRLKVGDTGLLNGLN
jgi:hypothetical protein